MRSAIPYILSFVITVFSLLTHNSYADVICSNSSSTSSSGTLYDAGGSAGNYSNFQRCGFLIQPTTSGDITLSFSAFDYERNYDYVYVYDGTNTSGTLLGRFTGYSLPASVTATSGAMYIVHSTDYSIRKSGFAATWTTVARDISVYSMCSSTTSSSGTLYDPGGVSGRYSNYQQCQFLIQPESEGDITLSFNSFEYESGYDYLYVYDGTSTSGTLLGRFSGSSLPTDVTATSGAMYLVHSTDYSIRKEGFAATWTTSSPTLTLLAEWHFEDGSWSGVSGEVVDSSGNDYHGQLVLGASLQNSSAAISGDTGTCDYARFSSGAVSINDLPVSTTTGDKTTVSFWMRWDGTNASMPIGWSSYDLWFYNGSFGFNTWNNDIYGINSSPLNGGWHHITAEFTNGSGAVTSNRLWVDGVAQSLSQRVGSPSRSFRAVGSQFRVGGASNSSSYFFHGDIDEVKIYSGRLSTSQVVEVMNQTHRCGSKTASSFLINHDNNGVYCANESIAVSARDTDGAIMTGYSGSITLDTQTGTGSWSLVSGSGSLVDATSNDGLAIYSFAEGDNGAANFALNYTEGSLLVNVDVYDSDARDDDSEGDITFSATGFSVTASPLSNPPSTPINDPVSSPKNAGEAFSIAVAAYGVDPDSGQCGIIETYTGNKNITLGTDYSNPSSGTLSASGSGVVSFSAGQAVINTQYNDVGEIRLTVSDSSAGMSGQSTSFVVKPTNFSLVASNNPSTTTSGTGFMAAGEAFTVTVQALNALGESTPNYGNEQTPENVTLAVDSLVFPIGGSLGVLNDGASFTKTAANTFNNTAVNWSEVGSIRLSASVADGDYLGAGDVTSSASDTIGRFYPYDFFMSGHSVVNSCSSFTYLSQPDLSINYSITAITRNGDTVTNYDAGLGYPVGAVEYLAEHNNEGTNLGSRLSTATSTWSAGEYVVADTAAVFARSGSPEAPLSDVVLGVSVDDIDDAPMNAANLNATSSDDCELAGECDAVRIGSASFYYGRLTLADAYGPETAALPAQLHTEYWDGTQYVMNVYDNCSIISRSAVSMNGSTIISENALSINLVGGTTSAQFDVLNSSDIGFLSGDAGLSFSAPGASIASKSFTVDVDLSAMSWLRSDWNQNGSDSDDTALPTATMSFKTYRGHDRVLYWRHNN